MSKAKTPSKQSENTLPKNLMKKKRIYKEADKFESDNDNDEDYKKEPFCKSNAKSKSNHTETAL